MYGIVYTAFYFGMGIERLDALANFGSTTDGTVAAKQPEQHRSIVYYYVVNNLQYTGQGGSGNGNPDFDSLQIGDRVEVKYDELYPLDSYLGDPKYQAASDRGAAHVVSFIISLVIMGQAFGIFLIVRQVRKSRSQDPLNMG